MKTNKRGIFISCVCLLCLLSCVCLFGCGGGDSPEKPSDGAKQFTGITFADMTVPYDGTEHSIVITGTLPSGTKVDYTNNTGTDVGVYNATAVLSGEGYESKTLTAKLTIEGKQFTGITFADKTVTYDGAEQSVTITGALPSGAKVDYTNNTGTDAGVYNATAALSGEGYESKTLTAKLTVNKADIPEDGIEFADKTVTFDGTAHSITVTGALPSGTKVEYANNTGTDVGVYNATATVSNPNYNTLVLRATLTVKAAVNESDRAIFADGDTLYFANALDGDRLYSYANSAVTKISGDVAHDFVKMGTHTYFRSGALFMSRIKAIESAAGDGTLSATAVASEKGEYLCTDGTNLYFVDNGIYKLTLGGTDPVVTQVSPGKAKYLQYYNGKLYFADGENGWKLSSVSVTGGARTQVVNEKITCLVQYGGVLYFTVDNLAGNYIARYTISNGATRKLTRDAGVNLTVINDKLFYINVDIVTSQLHGKGIYVVNANPVADNQASGQKVIGEEGETYSSLTAVGNRLAYYKVSTQMLCLSDTDGSNTVQVLDGFVPPEYKPASTGSKVLSYDGKIYFMDIYNDKALYSYDPTAKSFARLTANKVSDFSVIGDTLYFNEVSYGVNNDLYSVSLRLGGEPKRVSTYDCNDIVSDGTALYYVEQNAAGVRTAIHKIDATGNDTILYTKGADYLTYYDGALYFVDGKDLLKISVTDPDATVVTVKEGNVDRFVIENGVVYFREMYGVAWGLKRLSRINIDGTGYQKMMTADTDPLYIQVVGDRVYYYSDITGESGSGIFSVGIHAKEDETPQQVIARTVDGKKYYAAQFTVTNGKIYFVNYYNTLGDSHLYCVDIATHAIEKIA